MKILTRKDTPRHGMYYKVEGQLEWWQYYRNTKSVWYLFGWLPIWVQESEKIDIPLYQFLN